MATLISDVISENVLLLLAAAKMRKHRSASIAKPARKIVRAPLSPWPAIALPAEAAGLAKPARKIEKASQSTETRAKAQAFAKIRQRCQMMSCWRFAQLEGL